MPPCPPLIPFKTHRTWNAKQTLQGVAPLQSQSQHDIHQRRGWAR